VLHGKLTAAFVENRNAIAIEAERSQWLTAKEMVCSTFLKIQHQIQALAHHLSQTAIQTGCQSGEQIISHRVVPREVVLPLSRLQKFK